MYHRDDSGQLTMEEFFQPFGGRLRKDNRWVCLAGIMPWEYIEEIYVKNLSGGNGPPGHLIPNRFWRDLHQRVLPPHR